MKFLLDQDVFASTQQLLVSLGHDVATAAQLGMCRASDEDLLEHAQSSEMILVTRDRGYGNLVFVQAASGGVIYLRLTPATLALVHAELERILTLYSESELKSSFVVVEPGRHRMRRV